MKSLITRVDERLHRRIKERAADQGKSVNRLVTELLEAEVGAGPETPEEFRAELVARGLLSAGRDCQIQSPSDDELVELSAGAGSAVSAALQRNRGPRS